MIKKLFRYLFKKLIQLFLAGVVFSVIVVASLAVIDPPTWMWKIHRQLSPPENFPSSIKHHWRDDKQIAGQIKLAVIAAEDQLFPQHGGFDVDSIRKAIQERQDGGRLRGASTITQQTAKNLFLWSEKSLFRKGLEAWFTLLMELMLEKQRILELYLNIVEFGPGIFGVEAASQSYFGKTSAELNRRESARLAAVLPNPYRYSVRNPSAYIQKRVLWIEQQMRQLGLKWLEQMTAKNS
jgi:monofunctional biosynthetic peptidoglycan transglycosylase